MYTDRARTRGDLGRVASLPAGVPVGCHGMRGWGAYPCPVTTLNKTRICASAVASYALTGMVPLPPVYGQEEERRARTRLQVPACANDTGPARQ